MSFSRIAAHARVWAREKLAVSVHTVRRASSPKLLQGCRSKDDEGVASCILHEKSNSSQDLEHDQGHLYVVFAHIAVLIGAVINASEAYRCRRGKPQPPPVIGLFIDNNSAEVPVRFAFCGSLRAFV